MLTSDNIKSRKTGGDSESCLDAVRLTDAAVVNPVLFGVYRTDCSDTDGWLTAADAAVRKSAQGSDFCGNLTLNAQESEE